MNGKLLWQKDLGDKQMRNEFGEGSTPVLFGRYLVVVWDHQGESFIVALDKSSGNEIWRVRRDEIDSWATPLVVEHGGRPQVVTSGMTVVGATRVLPEELPESAARLRPIFAELDRA